MEEPTNGWKKLDCKTSTEALIMTTQEEAPDAGCAKKPLKQFSTSQPGVRSTEARHTWNAITAHAKTSVIISLR